MLSRSIEDLEKSWTDTKKEYEKRLASEAEAALKNRMLPEKLFLILKDNCSLKETAELFTRLKQVKKETESQN